MTLSQRWERMGSNTKERIQTVLQVIWMMVVIVGLILIVYDYVKTNQDVRLLIQDHRQEVKR
jgi:hypothetical protein